MKANEYFKKHGYRHCKSACMQNGWLNTGFWVQLKRLVKSHDLVKQYNGLFEAKELIRVSPKMTSELRELAAAIADVESCQ